MLIIWPFELSEMCGSELKSYSVSTGLVHVKTIAVFITGVWQPTWQKHCSAEYVVGNIQ